MTNNHDHRRHVHPHHVIRYPISVAQKLFSIFLWPVLILALMFSLIRLFSVAFPLALPSPETISFQTLLAALGYTLGRLGIAYVLAVIFAIPLAILATYRPMLETIFLPVFDILESVPILAFFPVLIIVFIQFNFLNGAAIFILFLSMLWNIVFTLIGGINVIPKDIIAAAHVFGLRGWQYFWKVLLPAMMPQLATGSILAFAQGWNLIIVAEVLHTYIPHGTSAQDLFGIGSVLVNAAASGQSNVFLWSVAAMVVAIALMNFFIWQKLLHYVQRFRFE